MEILGFLTQKAVEFPPFMFSFLPGISSFSMPRKQSKKERRKNPASSFHSLKKPLKKDTRKLLFSIFPHHM